MVSKTFDPRWLVALALGSGTILVESSSFYSYYDPSFFPAHRTKRFAETCLVILLITVRKALAGRTLFQWQMAQQALPVVLLSVTCRAYRDLTLRFFKTSRTYQMSRAAQGLMPMLILLIQANRKGRSPENSVIAITSLTGLHVLSICTVLSPHYKRFLGDIALDRRSVVLAFVGMVLEAMLSVTIEHHSQIQRVHTSDLMLYSAMAVAPAICINIVLSGEAYWLREAIVINCQHLGFARYAINALWGISAVLMLTFLSMYCTTLNSALTASLASGVAGFVKQLEAVASNYGYGW